MKAERVVLDSNVLISAALSPHGPPREVAEAVREARGVLLFCDQTFDELRSRFHRAKFDRYVGRQDRAVYLAQLEAVSEWVSIAGAKLGCRDSDDDKLLETALMGAADCLVTGNRDLFGDVSVAGHSDCNAGGFSRCLGSPITAAAIGAAGYYANWQPLDRRRCCRRCERRKP